MSSIRENIERITMELPDTVRLIAVSKFHPVDALMQAYDAGQRLFGENRAQEVAQKHPLMPPDVQWHFIGHLQTNKVKMIVPFVSMIHSIDSLKLLKAVDAEAERAHRVVDVLLQLHVAQEETKFGFTIDECRALIDSGDAAAMLHVRFCGVMGMASNTPDAARVRSDFRAIRATFDALRASHFADHPEFCEVSMGMSHDYRIAVDEGSTMVRIGTSIFGERQY